MYTGLLGGLQGPWFWWGDATTVVSANVAPSQRWCGRGVLACPFELWILRWGNYRSLFTNGRLSLPVCLIQTSYRTNQYITLRNVKSSGYLSSYYGYLRVHPTSSELWGFRYTVILLKLHILYRWAIHVCVTSGWNWGEQWYSKQNAWNLEPKPIWSCQSPFCK